MRRGFLDVLGGASVLPFAARAQQSHRIARIGYLAFKMIGIEMPTTVLLRADEVIE
jgi:hypothetical protein